MTLKQQRLLIHFFEVLEAHLRFTDTLPLSKEVKDLLSKEECIDIILWLSPEKYHRKALEALEEVKLHELLVTDYNILLYIIYTWKLHLTKTISFSDEEVEALFTRTNNETHYLYSKPIKLWDGYDRSNYISLLNKAGFTTLVYGIYSSSVSKEDIYILSSPPNILYDTKAEAEQEVHRCIQEENFRDGDLVVYPLYKIK